MHETLRHENKHDQIHGTSPKLNSHSLCVVKSKEIPKRNLNAKENGIYKGRSAGYLLWVVSGARWASAIIWWEVGVVASS